MFKKISIIVYALALFGFGFVYLSVLISHHQSFGIPVSINLTRGPFTVLDFPGNKRQTPALILLASGDFGWGYFEESICRDLQSEGYETIGINSHSYAATDYNLSILQADFTTIAQTFQASHGGHPPPLIILGYSMGAAQAIAVAGGPHPPAGLSGIALIDPLSRGRYGLRLSDIINIVPTGPGTFCMSDFSRTMGPLRIVQWHASEDTIDSQAWLQSVTVPYEEFNVPNESHDYSYNRDEFIHRLIESIRWILEPTPMGNAVSVKNNP